MIRSPLLRLAVVAMLASGLAGCLQPVHGTRLGSGSSAIDAVLADVTIDSIPGYLGYNLQSELDYLFTGGAKSPTRGGRYILKVKTQQTKGTTIIDQQTARAQTVTLQVEAIYVLIDQRDGGKIKASGKASASGSFDRSQLRYATLRAQRDAEERVAKALAERLKILVIAALRATGQAAGAGQTPTLSPPIEPDTAPAADPGEET